MNETETQTQTETVTRKGLSSNSLQKVENVFQGANLEVLAMIMKMLEEQEASKNAGNYVEPQRPKAEFVENFKKDGTFALVFDQKMIAP